MRPRTDFPAAAIFPRMMQHCAQCGAPLVAPDWTEQMSERRVRHLWSCEACGYQFETSIYFAARS
jgi:hypothetical protein